MVFSIFSSAPSKVTSIYSQINTANKINQSNLSQCESAQNSTARVTETYSKQNNCPDIPYYHELKKKLVESKISDYFHNTKQSHFYQFLMRSFSLKGQLAFINPETLSNIYSIDIFRVSKEKILIRATYDHCFGEAFGELINFNEFQQAVIAEINGDIKQEGIIADAPEQVSLIKKQEQLKQFITDKITQLTPQNGSWVELNDKMQLNNLIELTAAAPSILGTQMLAGCGKFINLPNLNGRKVYFCQTSSSQYKFKIASSAENTSPENNSRNFTFQELEAHLRKKEAMEKNVKKTYAETSSSNYSITIISNIKSKIPDGTSNSPAILTSVTSSLEQKKEESSRINKFLVKKGITDSSATNDGEKKQKSQEIQENFSSIIQIFKKNVDTLKNNGTEYFARTAFGLVRNRFKNIGIKSANKYNFGNAESVERMELANLKLPDVRKKINQTDKDKGSPNYRYAWEMAVGNCSEMAGIAAQLINASGGYAKQYRVDDKGTHAFTLVGIPPNTATDNVHFSDYDGCWVVDPWAGIVCEASQYTQCFETKMNQWSKKNKMIYDYCLDSWIKANSADWLKAVTNGHKVALFQ